VYKLQRLMISRQNVCGFGRSDFEHIMTDLGEKPFRGRQLYKWIYKKRVTDFAEMSDLRKEFRERLGRKFSVVLPKILDRQKSSDGTEKLLFGLEDGSAIESVLIYDDAADRMTLCISSQVGCALDCAFCATGKLGYKRNMTVGEIVGQLLAVRNEYGDDAFDNLVFMGMGEPLLNYDNVMASIDIMTDSLGLMLGAKKITISTAGVVSGIERLAASGSKVNLAVSLHAASDAFRRRIMPVAKSFSLGALMEAIREWTSVRNRRVTFEYILFKGLNDREVDARELAKLIAGIPCKINLLGYNPVEGADFLPPDDDDIDRFARILYPRTPAVTVRKSRGKDIAAACGQLAGKKGYR